MDVRKAIEFGELVGQAVNIPAGDLTNSAGKTVSAGGTDYTVVTTIYANDLATDVNPGRAADEVSIGLICQSAVGGDVAIAIRGTTAVLEWIQDVKFDLVPCPFLAGAGQTEEGFTDMYQSLRTDAAPDSPTVVKALGALEFPRPVGSLTVCGYSLGGALATLLALDVAAHTTFRDPTVYTYASPRVGDSLFASTYNQVVTASNRIENRLDIIPKLPPSPYVHVLSPYELNPIRFSPPPAKVLVEFTPHCEHSLATYLYLLSLQSSGPVIPLETACQP